MWRMGCSLLHRRCVSASDALRREAEPQNPSTGGQYPTAWLRRTACATTSAAVGAVYLQTPEDAFRLAHGAFTQSERALFRNFSVLRQAGVRGISRLPPNVSYWFVTGAGRCRGSPPYIRPTGRCAIPGPARAIAGTGSLLALSRIHSSRSSLSATQISLATEYFPTAIT